MRAERGGHHGSFISTGTTSQDRDTGGTKVNLGGHSPQFSLIATPVATQPNLTPPGSLPKCCSRKVACTSE
ncbi:hypothetical protein ARUE_c13190 [Arthrobacter sp. Rue61a]|nr:hypothetical protein ARUE_c13190 [Arthrobacter sp. Rue61a]